MVPRSKNFIKMSGHAYIGPLRGGPNPKLMMTLKKSCPPPLKKHANADPFMELCIKYTSYIIGKSKIPFQGLQMGLLRTFWWENELFRRL